MKETRRVNLWLLISAITLGGTLLAALIGAVVAGVLLILRYKEEICDFFAELKMKYPCKRCEEDDYADEELNSLCDMDSIIE